MLVFLFAILIAISCQHLLPYKPDTGFLNSAQANSPEYLVRINGVYCKDMDGSIGLCAKRVRSDEKISFHLDSRPYAYRLNVTCSSNVGFNLSIDILQNASFDFDIDAGKFSNSKSFTCVGEVFPQDREESVSAFWHARFVVYDKDYQAREAIYSDGKNVILGQYAKYSVINDDIKLKNTSVYKFKDIKRAFSESEMMRFNYYGY